MYIFFTFLIMVKPHEKCYYKPMEEPFYKNGLKFSCKRCSSCCGHAPGFVYLSESDLKKLCEFFKLSIKDFVEKYCREADYYEGKTVIALAEQKNYDCILWKNGCTAYEARPVQCSSYPFWTWMVQDKKTWDEMAEGCPGINQGKIWSKEFIDETKDAYEKNVPITKEELEKLIAG